MIKLNIYQINLDRDAKGLAFESYDLAIRYQRGETIDARIYDKVYSAEIPLENLEEVYAKFNIDMPDDYKARSVSVSDVIEVTESNTVQPGFYYCDSIGFKKIDFEASECGRTEPPRETVRVKDEAR